MELGIHFANFTLPGGPAAIGSILSDTARAAEEGGCTTFTLMDHYFQMEEFADRREPMLEGYTQLVVRALASFGMVYSQAPIELCRSYTALTIFSLPISPAATNSFAFAYPILLTRWLPTCKTLPDFLAASNTG